MQGLRRTAPQKQGHGNHATTLTDPGIYIGGKGPFSTKGFSPKSFLSPTAYFLTDQTKKLINFFFAPLRLESD
jgi:hypothetical protein